MIHNKDYILLWRRKSDCTIFLFAFEICLRRQPCCLLGSGLVCPNSVRLKACSNYMIVRYFVDPYRSKSATHEFGKLDSIELLELNIQYSPL